MARRPVPSTAAKNLRDDTGAVSQALEVELDRSVVEAVRARVASGGVEALKVDDLRPDDLGGIGWSGNPAHIRSVASALERAAGGAEDYLVVRAPSGQPVAKIRIDYTEEADTATLSQLATEQRVRRLGIATLLIRASEARIRTRRVSLSFASLGVEDDNPGARALYEQLGYQHTLRRAVSWEYEDERGDVRRYETEVAVLRKRLR